MTPRRFTDGPELEAVGTALLDQLDWHGLACIEYMRDARTGEYVLTEINPRMCESLPSAIYAGADFPYYYWLAAIGFASEITDTYDLGVGTHLLRGAVGYLVSVLTEDSPHAEPPLFPAAAWETASSIVREPHFDYLSLDDPALFITGLRHVVESSFANS